MTPAIPTDAEALAAFDVIRRWLGRAAAAPTAPPIFTVDPELEAKTGHTRRSLEDAIRRGELRAVKVARGHRIERADLEGWEQRPRVRPGPRRRDAAPASASPAAPRALRAVPPVDPDEQLLAQAVAGGGRRR